MADDQKPQNPASPSDQSTPPADIGQQPISTWPNSTNLANDQSSADSSLSNLANLPAEADASAKVGDQQSTPSAELVPEPPKEETPPQAPSPEIGQVEENSASANLANPTPPTVEPVVSADLSTEVEAKADSPATSSPPPVSPPLPSFPSSPTDLSSSIPTLETSPPPVTPSEPSEGEKPAEEIVDTNVQLPDNQAPQVQSEAPKDTPTIDTGKPQEDLANFKPESMESPQEAPLADKNVSASDNTTPGVALDDSRGVKESTSTSSVTPSITFGDLLSSENQAPSNPSTPSAPPIPSSPPAPSVPSPSAPISFGDLIKDIKPEESVIQPPPLPTAPSTPIPQPITNSPSLIPPSPPFPSSHSSFDVSSRHQKANQVRSQKKAKHLDKIMELARNSKSVSNTDVQRLLHVSQSTATNYLAELTKKGLLKRQGIRGGAKYTL